MGRFSKYVDMQMRQVRQCDERREAHPSLPECACEACVWWRAQQAAAKNPFKPVLPPRPEKAQHMIRRNLRESRNEAKRREKLKLCVYCESPRWPGYSCCEKCYSEKHQ